jgi:hypothetical protein
MDFAQQRAMRMSGGRGNRTPLAMAHDYDSSLLNDNAVDHNQFGPGGQSPISYLSGGGPVAGASSPAPTYQTPSTVSPPAKALPQSLLDYPTQIDILETQNKIRLLQARLDLGDPHISDRIRDITELQRHLDETLEKAGVYKHPQMGKLTRNPEDPPMVETQQSDPHDPMLDVDPFFTFD